MTRKYIIKQLAKYLEPSKISKLEIVSNKKDVLLILAVSTIIKEYESTLEEEKIVEGLLVKLVSICFK